MCNIIEKEELKSEKKDKNKVEHTNANCAHTQTEHQWRAQTDC